MPWADCQTGTRTVRSNRYRRVWERTHGRALLPGEVVMHLCDTPACENPDHLQLGSKSLNSLDAVQKGHQRNLFESGESHWNSKLTEQDVVRIRELGQRIPQYRIAAEYGVAQSTVSRILSGRRW